MIETPHAHFREIAVTDDGVVDSYHFRATSVGVYHIRHWIGSFSFMDAICLDTPVFDKDRREIIFKHAASFEIKDRFVKAKNFLEYLESIWFDANFDINYFDFQSAINDQGKSFESVRRFVGSNNKS